MPWDNVTGYRKGINMTERELQQEEELIQREFEALLDDYAHTAHRQNTEIITKAFHFAKQAHHGIRRRSGEPYIMHPLAVARIVVKEIGLGSTSICSALLHDVVEDTDYTTEDIANLFGEKIATIVDGLTKISGGVFGKQASEQAENFRKLLLTMSEDIRVILIKMADRLHNMRTLEFQPQEKQYKIAGETQYIYAPLAHRLGLFPIKTELENLSFKYEHPEKYAELEAKLAANKDAQMDFFQAFSDPIRKKLTMLDYQFTLTARIKSVYSIWKKMNTKNIPFEDVYDLLAVRIIFEPNMLMSEKDQCWMIYSALTEIYKPHPERIRDWISTPKANGYEALHVTVMGQNGQWVEVQIRTTRMDEVAEKGLAAHGKYKLGESDESELDRWLRQIKELLKNPEPNAVEFMDTFKLNLFASEIFVFTPKGEIKTIAQGATALDFAYTMHSELGDHCIGAKVNHKLVPLSYVLQGGDQVEILTSHTQMPQEEWMNYVTTAKAKSRIQAYFRKEERKLMLEGEARFLHTLQQVGLADQYDAVLHKLLNYHHIQQPSQLMLQIGNGNLTLTNLEKIVRPKQQNIFIRYLTKPFSSSSESEGTQVSVSQSGEKSKKKRHIVLSEANMHKEYEIADGCHPIPGDDVLGYMDESGKIIIHKVECNESYKLKSTHGKRLYTASWNMHRMHTFLVTLEVKGIDKAGVIVKIINIVSNDFQVNMRDLHVAADDGIFTGHLQIYVYDTDEVNAICNAIRKIKEVNSVARINS